MKDFVVYFNGEWMPYSQVKINPDDRGLRLGDSVYDAIRTFNGNCFKLRDHIDRLYSSLKYVSIDSGLSDLEMEQIVEETVNRNEERLSKAGDFRVYIYISRGPGRWAYSSGSPTVLIQVCQLDFSRYAHLYKTGARGLIPGIQSYTVESLDPKIKHTSRMNFNLAEIEVHKKDTEAWPILTDVQGYLTEGTAYNVFIITNGVIKTSFLHGALVGISRATVFELAEMIGMTASEENILPEDIYLADEVFFTATSYCVLPVTKVDNHRIGDGKPGPVVKKLLDTWSDMVKLDIVEQSLKFA